MNNKVVGGKLKCASPGGIVMVECIFDKSTGVYHAISDTGFQAKSTEYWTAMRDVVDKMNSAYKEALEEGVSP